MGWRARSAALEQAGVHGQALLRLVVQGVVLDSTLDTRVLESLECSGVLESFSDMKALSVK
jgi:hypothetical protein